VQENILKIYSFIIVAEVVFSYHIVSMSSQSSLFVSPEVSYYID